MRARESVTPGGSNRFHVLGRQSNCRPNLEWAALALVGAWFLIFYWRATLGQGMFYFGDIARFFYPTRVLYAQALSAGRLPLWQPEMLMGFPLFAEMQTGALYPPHLLLYRLLPVDIAINYDILLHLAWLALGLYLFARARGRSVPGALITAFAFSAGGFGVGRITHLSVVSVAAWLPWSLWVYEKWRHTPRLRSWVTLVLIFGLEFLAGHPQFILLNVLTFSLYVAAAGGDAVVANVAARERARRGVLALLPMFTVALGAGLAAVQLLPTAELAQASARAGGVTEAFFTEFSYHPLYLALLVNPFVLGNPYPRVSVEVIAYLGALPLLLAVLAVLVRRDRATWFWLALAGVCFFFALGGFNPLYRGLRFLPLLNFFRVPARFLFPMSLALAMLAGTGFDALWARAHAEGSTRAAVLIGGAAIVLVALVIGLAQFVDADTWVSAWRVLAPLFFASALFVVLRAWRHPWHRATLAAVAVGLTLVDLAAFGAVYAQAFNMIAPRSEIFSRPRVLDNLSFADGARTRTSEWIFPWVSGMRESLYPNLQAAYGVQAADGYTPLIPRRTQAFLDHLSPAMLNLLGVRYYLVPQVLPVDAQSEGADLADPFMIQPVGRALDFMRTEATGIEIESALAQSADLTDGDVVANILLTTDTGQTLEVPLRAGYDTAEWAYDRSDVRRSIKHSEPPVASTFPARSAFPVESHPGHFYRAALNFSASPVGVVSLTIQPKIAAGLIHIQKLTLTNGASHVDLATLVGKSNHKLIYRSEEVAVFENPDYAPRAFLTHNAVVEPDDAAALARLGAPNYAGELLLAGGEGLPTDMGQGLDEEVSFSTYEPEHVVLHVKANAEAYVVLADTWDAGWVAQVDGQPAPIQRADVIFRAVRVSAGEHRIEFNYRPFSFYAGAVISGLSLAIVGIVMAVIWLVGRRAPRPVI